MQLFINVVCVYVCMYTLNEYGITYTTLGNAGRNAKPIDSDYFEQVKNIVEGIGTGVQYRNSEKVRNALEKYANANINRILGEYIDDIEYSLVEDKFLTYTGENYKKYPELYHRISKEELKIHKSPLVKFERIDINNDKVLNDILKILYTEQNKDMAIAHFVKYAQDYLVQQGILSKQANSIVVKTNDIKNIIRKESEQTLNTQVDIDSNANEISAVPAIVDNDVPAGALSNEAHAVDTAIDTSADIKNDLYNKFNRFMSMLRVGQHYKSNSNIKYSVRDRHNRGCVLRNRQYGCTGYYR